MGNSLVFQVRDFWRIYLCLCALFSLGVAFKKINDDIVTEYLNAAAKNKSLSRSDDVCLKSGCTIDDNGRGVSFGASSNVSEYYRFFVNFPSATEFLPIDSSNERCAAHSRLVLQQFQQFQLWALQMVDSTAKIPSGLLEGNVNQLGHFDQCLSTASEDGSVTGQYCLAALSIKLPEPLKSIDDFIHSYYYMTSDLDDPGHRVPHFSSMDWAFCIPSSCSHSDVEDRVRQVLERATRGIHNLSLSVAVKRDMCQSKHHQTTLQPTSPIVLFFSFCVFLCALATVLDYRMNSSDSKSPKLIERGRAGKLLFAFSLRRNLNHILDTKPSSDEIPSLHGARFMAAVALLLSHKNMALLYSPFSNRNSMVFTMSKAWSVIGRTAIIYTDVFIFISGVLTGINLFKQLDKNRKLNLFDIYFNRWLRFTPNLLVVILFCTYVLPSLGSGPMWNLVVSRHADLCTNNAWRSLLYIHNYFGFENMCLTHTHQLGIDMQLFILAPIFVYAIWRWPRFGFILTFIVATLSTALRFYVTYHNNLSVVITFGISVSQLFAVANLSYILPTHRLTVYLMGTITAYYLHYQKEQLRVPKAVRVIGWCVAIVCGLWAFIGPYKMAYMNFVYEPFEAAVYTAFAPVVWGFFCAWSVIMTAKNHAGWFGALLSWPYFKMFTQIAYAIYLTQFPIFFYNIGRIRSPMEHYPLMMFNIAEYGVIFFASLVLTVMFDLPFQHVRKIFWPSVRGSYLEKSLSKNLNAFPDSTVKKPDKLDKYSNFEMVENNNSLLKRNKKLS